MLRLYLVGVLQNYMSLLKKETKWIVPAPFLHPVEQKSSGSCTEAGVISEVRGELANIWRGWAFRCAGSPLCPGCCGHRCISVCRCSCSEPLPSPAFTHAGCSVLSFPLYLWFPTFPTIDAYAAETVKAYPLHTNWSPDFQQNCRLCILTDWRDNWK